MSYPAPRRRGHPTLYLDFDGVVHPEAVYWSRRRGVYIHDDYSGHSLFEHAGLLAELLLPYPNLDIVLSTSWVQQYGCARASAHLPTALRNRVVGATYHSRMPLDAFREMPRGHQVQADSARRQPATWLAIDDTDEGWDAASDNVVITHAVNGIAEPVVLTRLTKALERFS